MPRNQRRSKTSSLSSAAVVDGRSTKDMSKDQLWEQAILLQEEVSRVLEEKTNFKLERDKNLCLWEIYKKNLDYAEGQLRNKRWEKEEAKERHRREISSYELKLKHVQLEQHDTVTVMKLDAEAAAFEVQDQHNRSTMALYQRILDLKAERRERIAQNEMRLKHLKMDQQKESMMLNEGYSYRMQEMGKIFNGKLCSLIATEDKKTREALEEVDERMRLRVLEVEKESEQKMQDAAEYQPLLLKVAKLKEEEQQVLEENQELDRKLSAAKEERERLVKRVKEGQLKGIELQQQLIQVQCAEAKRRARERWLTKEIREQTVKNELLQQAVEKAQLEHDELLQSNQSQMLELQEHHTMKEMMLKKEITSLTKTLQSLQLNLESATLAAGSGGRV